MRAVFWGALTLGLGALGFDACTFQIEPGQTAIVTRFGDPRRVVEEPGLGWKLPTPIDVVHVVDRRLHVLDPGSGEFLTSDKENVQVDGFLLWRVDDPELFFRRFSDVSVAENRLEDLLRSELRNILTEHPLSALVSIEEQEVGLADLAAEVSQRAHEQCRERFGIDVRAVRIKRINFPDQNRNAVFGRMRAERQRVARQFRSEGEMEAAKIRQDADEEAARVLAEARKEAEQILGTAKAEVTRIYGEAFGADPEFYEFQRALEAYGKVFGEDDTVVVPADAWLLKVLRGELPFSPPPVTEEEGG